MGSSQKVACSEWSIEVQYIIIKTCPMIIQRFLSSTAATYLKSSCPNPALCVTLPHLNLWNQISCNSKTLASLKAWKSIKNQHGRQGRGYVTSSQVDRQKQLITWQILFWFPPIAYKLHGSSKFPNWDNKLCFCCYHIKGIPPPNMVLGELLSIQAINSIKHKNQHATAQNLGLRVGVHVGGACRVNKAQT